MPKSAVSFSLWAWPKGFSASHLLQTLLKVWAQVHTWMIKRNYKGSMSITMASPMFLPVKGGFKNEGK